MQRTRSIATITTTNTTTTNSTNEPESQREESNEVTQRQRRIPQRNRRAATKKGPYQYTVPVTVIESDSEEGSVTWPRQKHVWTSEGWCLVDHHFTDEQLTRWKQEELELEELRAHIRQWQQERSDRWKAELQDDYEARKQRALRKAAKRKRNRQNRRRRRHEQQQQQQEQAIRGNIGDPRDAAELNY